MEGQDGGVDAEGRVTTQHFHVSVLEIEGFVWNHGHGVDGELLVRGICDGGANGGVVIGNVCGREVGESGDADGRRVSDGGDRGCRNYVRLWDGDRFELRRLRGARFGISVGKPERCDDGSCSGVFLVRASRF